MCTLAVVERVRPHDPECAMTDADLLDRVVSRALAVRCITARIGPSPPCRSAWPTTCPGVTDPVDEENPCSRSCCCSC